MAQIATRWPTEAERQRVEKIIAQHDNDFERPNGVRRIAFSFREDQAGNPAVYLEIFVDKDLPPTKENIDDLNDFVQVIINDILADDKFEYWPYARTLVED